MKQQDWRRAFWIVPNRGNIGIVLLQYERWSTNAAAGRVLVLIVDWLVIDHFSGYVNRRCGKPNREAPRRTIVTVKRVASPNSLV